MSRATNPPGNLTGAGPLVAVGVALALAAGAVSLLIPTWAAPGQRLLTGLIIGLPWAVLGLQFVVDARHRRWRSCATDGLLLVLAVLLLLGL